MKYVKGSILDATQHYIAHGCNSQGVMGAGVALALRTKWPVVYDIYREAIDMGQDKLGDLSLATVADDKMVANLITQEGISHRRREANYSAVIMALQKLIIYTDARQIAIPKIGCGLGGCDWNVMDMLLEDFELMNRGVEFTVYDI